MAKRKSLRALMHSSKAEAKAKPRLNTRAVPASEELIVKSISLTPAALETLQRLMKDTGDHLGRKVSASSVVRALLAEVIGAAIELELNSGAVVTSPGTSSRTSHSVRRTSTASQSTSDHGDSACSARWGENLAESPPRIRRQCGPTTPCRVWSEKCRFRPAQLHTDVFSGSRDLPTHCRSLLAETFGGLSMADPCGLLWGTSAT